MMQTRRIDRRFKIGSENPQKRCCTAQGHAKRIVDWVLRESCLETDADLKQRADKLRQLNSRMEMLRTSVSRTRVAVARLKKGETILVRRVPLVPNSSPTRMDKEEAEADLEDLEERLNAMGDDAQLANLDLQTTLRRSRHSAQMMSKVSRMPHETVMNTIRNMK